MVGEKLGKQWMVMEGTLSSDNMGNGYIHGQGGTWNRSDS